MGRWKKHVQRIIGTVLVARFAWTVYFMHSSTAVRTLKTTKWQQQQEQQPPAAAPADLSLLLLGGGHRGDGQYGPSKKLLVNSWTKTTAVSSSSADGGLQQQRLRVVTVQHPDRKEQQQQQQAYHDSAARHVVQEQQDNLLLVHHQIQLRQQQRRQRTTPPPPLSPTTSSHATTSGTTTTLRYNFLDSQTKSLSLSSSNSSASSSFHSFSTSKYTLQQQCRDAGLNSTSRLLVLGLDGLTASFLITAAQACHVRHVILVDPLFPNTRQHRLSVLQTLLRQVQQRVGPQLHFHVPTNSATLLNPKWLFQNNKKKKKKNTPFTFSSLTHVLAVQSSSYYDAASSPTSTVMDESAHRLYTMHHDLLLWNQVIRMVLFLQQQQQQSRASQNYDNKHPPSPPLPRFLYVSRTATTTPSTSHHQQQQQQQHQVALTGMVQILSLAHATASERRHGRRPSELSIAHVTFPLALVGPLVTTTTNTATITTSTGIPSTSASVMHITEAVSALFQAYSNSSRSSSNEDGRRGGVGGLQLWTVDQPQWTVSQSQWKRALAKAAAEVAAASTASSTNANSNATTPTLTTTTTTSRSSDHDYFTRLGALQTLQWQRDEKPTLLVKGAKPPPTPPMSLLVEEPPAPQEQQHSLSDGGGSNSLFSTFAAADALLTTNSPSFPCSSSCRRGYDSTSTTASATTSSATMCQSSYWDKLRPLSRKATAGCKYVVYLLQLDRKLDSLVRPGGGADQADPSLCRVAFVHYQSILVQRELARFRGDVLGTNNNNSSTNDNDHTSKYNSNSNSRVALDWNGQIQSNQWTLIWIDSTSATRKKEVQDEAHHAEDELLSLADSALLKIDPSRMFADSVIRAMYAENSDYVAPSDRALVRLLRVVGDRPAMPARQRRERRSGVSGIARWVPVPPEPARRTILFASEPAPFLPRNVRDFARMAGGSSYLPPQQLQFYEQVAHLVQTNDMRPEPEIRSTAYFSFPFQWISTSILIHDLTPSSSGSSSQSSVAALAAQELRCRWYDEYLHWGGNRDAEELSLAYVMATMRIAGEMGLPAPYPSLDADEKEDLSWMPLLMIPTTSASTGKYHGNDDDDDDEVASTPRRLVEKGQEVFVRIMKRQGRKD